MDPGLLLTVDVNSPQICYITKGDYIHWGGTAAVERLPNGTIIKTPAPGASPFEEEFRCRDMEFELHVYRRIHEVYGDHPRIPRVFKWYPETFCLTMEFLENGNLETFVQEHPGISSMLRLKWAKQAAEGLQVLHSLDLIHCDVFPRNFLLDSEYDLKICDFSGSSWGGSELAVVTDTRYLHSHFDVRHRPLVGDDLFSLGSLIYFIMTGIHPYGDFLSDEVAYLYDTFRFPDTTRLLCGDIIRKCWLRQFENAQEVYDALRLEESNL